MTNTIVIVSKTASFRRLVEGTHSTYETVDGEVTQRDLKGYADGGTLFDGMIDAAEGGQISWIKLDRTIARGTAYNQENGGQDRYAVIDVDNAGARDVLDAVTWLGEA